jgi:AcrR family transcriptional regulator
MSPRRPRRASRDNESARKHILSGAAELFMERGYHATSVREIGDYLDISQSSLYYHAKNKPQILVDLNDEFMSGLVEAMEEINARDETPLEKLKAVIAELLEVVAEHQAVVTVVLHERRSLPEESAEAIQVQRDRVDEIIDGIIAAGIADGEIASLSPAMVRLALTGMTNWAYTWYDADGSLTAEQIAESFATILFDGIRPRPKKSRKR